MKKIFLIFIFSTLSFALGALVFAQNLDDYPAPTPNTPNNDQALRNLMGDAYVDSCAVAESTATIDPATGQRNDAANATCNDSKSDGIIFIPNVDIPVFFEGKQEIGPESIGLYINAVYKYGAGFAGVVAVFMIVFAAWQWIIAAGNSGKIENAKDTIISALIGLALLFGGYLLLSQISSRLVDLQSLDGMTPIKSRFLKDDTCEPLEKKDCQSTSDCYWSEVEQRCGINSMCDISIDLARSKNYTGRLLCCADKFALKGEFADTCGRICGPEYEDVEGDDLEECKAKYCGVMDGEESACKMFQPVFCEWDEDDDTCDEFGGQRGIDGDDCDDPTDCLPGFCCAVDNLSANDCRPIESPEADDCMEAINPLQNCSGITSCGDYTNSTHCLQNNCRSAVGDCRWDEDGTDECLSISSGLCGGNAECLTASGETNTNSQYCCCETGADKCELRSSCGARCQTAY